LISQKNKLAEAITVLYSESDIDKLLRGPTVEPDLKGAA
jgi:hypothetical protein